MAESWALGVYIPTSIYQHVPASQHGCSQVQFRSHARCLVTICDAVCWNLHISYNTIYSRHRFWRCFSCNRVKRTVWTNGSCSWSLVEDFVARRLSVAFPTWPIHHYKIETTNWNFQPWTLVEVICGSKWTNFSMHPTDNTSMLVAPESTYG